MAEPLKSPTTGHWRQTTTRRSAPMIAQRSRDRCSKAEFRQRLINGALFNSCRRNLSARQGLFYSQQTAPRRPAIAIFGSLEKLGACSRSTTNGYGAGTGCCSLTKRSFQDYNPRLSRCRTTDPFQNPYSEAISQAFLAGKGNRSYFEARSMYYFGFSQADVQSQIPVIHPVIDYNYTI